MIAENPSPPQETYKANFVEMRFSFVYRIGDRASFERLHQYPTGIICVLVNGVPGLDESHLTDALPDLRCTVPARQRLA